MSAMSGISGLPLTGTKREYDGTPPPEASPHPFSKKPPPTPARPSPAKRSRPLNAFEKIHESAKKGTLIFGEKTYGVERLETDGSSVDVFKISDDPNFVFKILKMDLAKDELWATAFFKDHQRTYTYLQKKKFPLAQTEYQIGIIRQEKLTPSSEVPLALYKQHLEHAVRHGEVNEDPIVFDIKPNNYGKTEKGQFLLFDWSQVPEDNTLRGQLCLNLIQGVKWNHSREVQDYLLQDIREWAKTPNSFAREFVDAFDFSRTTES